MTAKEKRKRENQLSRILDYLCQDLVLDSKAIATRKEYVYEKVSEVFPSSDSFRMAVTALLDLFFARAFQLIVLNHNASACLELYAVLERLALIYLPRRLGKDSASRAIIAELIQRKTLPELVDSAVKLGLWTKQVLIFVKGLSQKRNALAHRNYVLTPCASFSCKLLILRSGFPESDEIS